MPVMRAIYLRRSAPALRSHGPAADATTISGTGPVFRMTSSPERLAYWTPSENAAARSQTNAHFLIERQAPLLNMDGASSPAAIASAMNMQCFQFSVAALELEGSWTRSWTSAMRRQFT